MESNVRRPFFPAAKDILEDHTDKKVNFEFNNAVKGKPCLNVVYIMIIKLVLLYNDSGPIYSSLQKTPSSFREADTNSKTLFMIGNEFINNNNEEIVRDQHLASDRFL